jgi:hypothetical protein
MRTNRFESTAPRGLAALALAAAVWLVAAPRAIALEEQDLGSGTAVEPSRVENHATDGPRTNDTRDDAPAQEPKRTTNGGAAGNVEGTLDEAGSATRRGIDTAGKKTGDAIDKAITKTGEGIGYVIDKTGQGFKRAGEALSGEEQKVTGATRSQHHEGDAEAADDTAPKKYRSEDDE